MDRDDDGSVDLPTLRREASSLRHPLARTLLALTFVTGLVDGASYLGLGHVFAANMTGNVVLLGFGIAGASGLAVIAPLISLAAFLLGSVCGGRLAGRLSSRHRAAFATAITFESGFLLVAALLCLTVHVRSGHASGDAVIALLAVGMGARNATVRVLGIPDLNTTVLTMTLTALAAESSLGGGSRRGTLRRLSAAIVLLAGAIAGGLLVRHSLATVILVAFALAAVTGPAYAIAAARHRGGAVREGAGG